MVIKLREVEYEFGKLLGIAVRPGKKKDEVSISTIKNHD